MVENEEDFNYRVVGRWPFPVDMLRRDRSEAATPEDQAIIDRLSGSHANERSDFELHEVNLVIRNATRRERPLTARWESMRWSVPDDAGHAMIRGWKRAETARDAAYGRAAAKLTPEELEVVKRRGADEAARQ